MRLSCGTAQNGILPVGALAECGDVVVAVSRELIVVVAFQTCPFTGIEEIELFRYVVRAEGVAVVDAGLAGLSLLCRYYDDAVGTAAAVDGCCADILQDLYRLDVRRVDACQWVDGALNVRQPGLCGALVLIVDETVDDIQRVVGGVDGVAATDTYLAGCTGLTAAGRNVKSGNLSGEGLVEGRHLCLLEYVGLDGRHATGELLAFLSAVTYDHHLVEGVEVVVELHLQVFVCGLIYVVLLVAVASVTDNDGRREVLYVDGELSVDVGDGEGSASFVALQTDSGSDDGLSALRVDDCSVNVLCQ